MDYLTRLNDQIDKSGLTNKELAEAAGVSAATISRIRTGETNATWEVMVSLAQTLGLSLDELAGLKPATQEDVVFISKELIASYHSRLTDKDKTIGEKDDTIDYHRKWLKTFFVALSVVMLFILFVLGFDLLNGGIGYIRY